MVKEALRATAFSGGRNAIQPELTNINSGYGSLQSG
jgi:hypothetical protein